MENEKSYISHGGVEKPIDDLSDDEIIEISKIVDGIESVYYDLGVSEDEAEKIVRKDLRELRIDSATLMMIKSRYSEISEKNPENVSYNEMVKGYLDISKQKSSETIEIFDNLSRTRFPELTTKEERIFSAIFNKNVLDEDIRLTPAIAAKLTGDLDLSDPNFFREIKFQKNEFDKYISKKENDKDDIGVCIAARLKDKLDRCHRVLANHWFDSYFDKSSFKPEINIFKDEIAYPDGENSLSQKLNFLFDNASGKRREDTAKISLEYIKKQFVPFLKSGELDSEYISDYVDHYKIESGLSKNKLREECVLNFYKNGYNLLGKAIIFGDNKQSKNATDIFLNYYSKDITNGINPGLDIETFSGVIAEAIINSKVYSPKIVQPLDKILVNNSSEELVARLYEFGEDQKINKKGFVEALSQEIMSFISLEKKSPGSVARLKRDFNIDFIGRYPQELLLEMLNDNNSEKPYGILVYPKSDHNAVFHSGVFKLENFNKQLKEKGYILRIAEVDGKIGLLKTLLKQNNKHGNVNKISFLVISGHGEKHNIDFSRGVYGNLKSTDINGQGIRRLSDLFKPNATIILESCSTGQKGGIAETISDFFGVKVIAPTVPTYIENMYVTEQLSDNLGFDAEYFHDNDKVIYNKK